MTEREFESSELDRLFEGARAARAELPPALADRMVLDAMRTLHARARPPALPGWRAQLAEAIGGWFGVGGLATACAAGLWLGLAPPEGLPDPVSLWEQSQSSYDMIGVSDLALALSEDG